MTEQANEFQAPKVAVGWIVHFFPHAMPGEQPVPAIVQEVGFGGLLTLGTFPTSGRALVRPGVMHIEDPRLKTAETAYRLKVGAWAEIPGVSFEQLAELMAMLPALRCQAPRPAANEAMAQLDAEAAQAAIADMSRKGQTPEEIAQELGHPWTPGKVLQVIRRANKGERARAEP